jgi:hypothetical protein
MKVLSPRTKRLGCVAGHLPTSTEDKSFRSNASTTSCHGASFSTGTILPLSFLVHRCLGAARSLLAVRGLPCCCETPKFVSGSYNKVLSFASLNRFSLWRRLSLNLNYLLRVDRTELCSWNKRSDLSEGLPTFHLCLFILHLCRATRLQSHLYNIDRIL